MFTLVIRQRLSGLANEFIQAGQDSCQECRVVEALTHEPNVLGPSLMPLIAGSGAVIERG